MSDHMTVAWRNVTVGDERLKNFEAIWYLDIGWVEEPNMRRGGWSGVSIMPLPQTKPEKQNIYIKRQYNHVYKSWCHPIKGQTTFSREIKNIISFQQAGIATLEPLYYATRQKTANLRAILITKELAGYQSLDAMTFHWQQVGWPVLRLRRQFIKQLAIFIRCMHDAGFCHGCLYPKHLFIHHKNLIEIDIRIIDLEKARRGFYKYRSRLRDISALHRHSPQWCLKDKIRFLQYYWQSKKLSATERKFMKKILWRVNKKNRLPSKLS